MGKVLVEAHEIEVGDKLLSPSGVQFTVTHKETIIRSGPDISIVVQTLHPVPGYGWGSSQFIFNPKDKVEVLEIVWHESTSKAAT